ncbi:hypothetical protein [Oryzomonas rubra]|uniref:Uncharacterized protein n=1 Tax=Oryzomonas rubra TaxID=2509454 RepID=A0A5A9XN20_9BACT|nr:hypothetical protein [Oryzomonas rubra]KAA0894250.1 hypothetical protein ET418_04665 [Oryzomonas rubra]
MVDMHYTSKKELTANIVVCGEENEESEQVLSRALEVEISHIATQHSDYAIINYTLAYTTKLYKNKYQINELLRDYGPILRQEPKKLHIHDTKDLAQNRKLSWLEIEECKYIVNGRAVCPDVENHTYACKDEHGCCMLLLGDK